MLFPRVPFEALSHVLTMPSFVVCIIACSIARGGFFRTTNERDSANFSPDRRSAAGLTLALVLISAKDAAGGGMRQESASSLTSLIGPHSGSVPGPARPAVTCQKVPELVCGR